MTLAILDPRTMRDIAARCRCRVVRMQRWTSEVPGRAGIGYELECRTHGDKVRLLDLLAWNDAKRDMALREVAMSLAREAGPQVMQRARAIHRYVRDGVEFAREPRETFQDSFWTLWFGVGDCDDHARVVAALGRAMGLRVRLAILKGKRGSAKGLPTHVAAQFGFPVKRPVVWLWAETTLPAFFGEHPRAARRRLNALSRGDIG